MSYDFNYDPGSFNKDITPRASMKRGDTPTVISVYAAYKAAGTERQDGTTRETSNFYFIMKTEDGGTIKSCLNIKPKKRQNGSEETVEEMQARINRFLSFLQKAAFGGSVVKSSSASVDTLCERITKATVTPFLVTITNVNPKNGLINFYVGETVVQERQETAGDDTEASDFPQA